MVSSYLVYTGMSAEKALQVYAEKRTTNNEGVSRTGSIKGVVLFVISIDSNMLL